VLTIDALSSSLNQFRHDEFANGSLKLAKLQITFTKKTQVFKDLQHLF